MKDIRHRFAKALKKQRESKNLSVSGLAKVSNVSRQHIRELELSDCQKSATITTMEKLANGLGIKVHELLGKI